MTSSSPVNRISEHRSEAIQTGEPVLIDHLRRRIRSLGPITFADFMEAALYHPERGYYAGNRRPWGREGDYATTPQVGDALGKAVATFVLEADDLLGTRDPFLLMEVGGGDGRLLADVCRELSRRGADRRTRLLPVSVERSRRSRRRQERRFSELDLPVRVVASLEEIETLEGFDVPGSGCIFSNELLDAFPVHRVVGTTEGLQELRVDLDEEGRFVEVVAPPSTPRLQQHLRSLGVELEPGQLGEIALGVEGWVSGVAAVLRRGYLLTVDYGHPTETLYAAHRREGTLACHRRYRVHDDPYVHVGRQDLTAHVDFGNLRRCGDEHGFRTEGLTSLATFLLGFGAAADAGVGTGEARMRRHLALRHVLVSEVGQLHRVMLQSRDVEPALPFGPRRLEDEISSGPTPSSRTARRYEEDSG